jgi:hypothetical protein
MIAALMMLAGCGPVTPPPPTDLPPLTIDAQLPAPPPSSTIAPAVASRPAVRLMIFEQESPTLPPPPVEVFAPAALDGCAEMSWYRARAGLPEVFDRIGRRESNCRNEDGVHTFCCYGWWQLWVSLHLADRRMAPGYHACGVFSAADVNSDTPGDKARQACATAVLYSVVGLSAWQ